MPDTSSRVEVRVAVSRFSMEYRGGVNLFQDLLQPLLVSASAGDWPVPTAAGAPGSAAMEPPPDEPELAADDGLYAALGARASRSAERDAVLCALVELAGTSHRDVRAPEILALLAVRGYPGRPRVKPILAKLRDRHRHVEPGVAPGTWRPANAGRDRAMGLRAIAAE